MLPVFLPLMYKQDLICLGIKCVAAVKNDCPRGGFHGRDPLDDG